MKVMNLLLVASATMALSFGASAQEPDAASFPSTTVRMVVPYPAGGSTDTVTRLIAAKLADRWKQAVVVENRGGGAGVVGQTAVKNAPADGHSILLGITSFTYQSALRPVLDFTRTFAPVAMVGAVQQALIVPSSLPPADLKAFISLVKANPGKYSYATAGAATTAHIYGEMFNAQAGLDMLHVPYRGNPAIMNDILGNQIPAGFLDPVVIGQHLPGGKIRALAISGPKRAPSLPDVPTFTELGYTGFDGIAFIGYFVRDETPPAIVQKISRDIVEAASMPDVAAKIAELGVWAEPVAGDVFAKIVNDGRDVWEAAIKQRNITLEQ